MKLYCIGIGPGGEEQMTLRAVRALAQCDCVAGYGLYLDLIENLIEGKERVQTGMTREVDRCTAARDLAKQGRTVAVVSSGDAGVYGMAGLLLEVCEHDPEIEVEVIPGITAACSGGAVLGSPMTCDFACVSLSDLLTPWEVIEQRLHGAAQGDFCIALYNPASKKRTDHLRRACDILLEHQPPETVCGLVRNIGRAGEEYTLTTLGQLRGHDGRYADHRVHRQQPHARDQRPHGHAAGVPGRMKLVIFSGTSEGHALCRFLSARGAQAEVYVATEYGAAVMEPMRGITVHEGRLDTAAIAARLDADTLLIDATHPYAAAVTDNLCAACAETGARYERLLRPAQDGSGCETVPDTAAAVAWLNAHPGKVLLTTGSKELDAYTAVENWQERLYPRVLPVSSVLQKCEALGFTGAHVIAMQGPFTRGMNAALLRQTGARILVYTYIYSGGFAEKLAAAQDTGATVLVIARPRAETGRTLGEMQAYLAETLGLAEPAPAEGEALPRFPLFVPLAGKKMRGGRRGRDRGAAHRRAAAVRRSGNRHRAGRQAGVGLTHCRGYEESDLSGAFLAVAATDDRAVNHRISQDCAGTRHPVQRGGLRGRIHLFLPRRVRGRGG